MVARTVPPPDERLGQNQQTAAVGRTGQHQRVSGDLRFVAWPPRPLAARYSRGMAPRQHDDLLAVEWVTFRELSTHGTPEEAIRRSVQVLDEASDPVRVTQALIARMTLLFNTRNRDTVPSLLQQAEDRLRSTPHPRLTGQFHLLAANVAQDRRSYGIALLHAVKAQRALERMGERTRAAVDAWHDLAATYSLLGYHVRALHADRRAQELAATIGQPPAIETTVIAATTGAVYLDQRGDSEGCLRQLEKLVEDTRSHIHDLSLIDRVFVGYAVRRAAALQHPIAIDVPAERTVGPLLRQVNTLGDVCDALAARLPDRALALLAAAPHPLDVLGLAEPLRLKSIALSQLGDHPGALTAERAVLRISSREETELRTLLADSATALIDQNELRRSAEQHARAAVTDPLTGLPNRRRLEEFIAALTRSSKTAVVGMLDLDRFKAINDYHGHPTGDIVLQRVAGLLARELEAEDLVSRQGGDEFVIVLPDTDTGRARALGDRIHAAIRDQDWSAIVPNTPIEASIGWAELDTDVDGAFRAADAELYEIKRRHRITANG